MDSNTLSRRSTLFLMPEPHFGYGIARVLDLFGNFDLFNVSPTPDEADARALAADWCIVGEHLRQAIEAGPGLEETEPAPDTPDALAR